MACAVLCAVGCAPESGDERPNILLIVADDLGYSDISPYGSEIATPHLQALADSGTKFTRFYASPTCSPTRAMLMTGLDAHLVGLGTMAERRTAQHEGVAGYEGRLNALAVTLPEALREGGYRTYMTGKWHLGHAPERNPAMRGFERSFALLDGAAFHLSGDGYRDPAVVGRALAAYTSDGEPATVPEGFYSTAFYTDRLISYLEHDRADARPFFAYLALTAPHWPLQVPESSREKYAGHYDEGYDIWYERRLDGMRAAGVFPENGAAFPRYEGEKAWNELSDSERRDSVRRMEIQAAMIDDMDHHVGRLFAYLRAQRQFDNTVVLFISDNGIDARHIDQRIRSIGDWPQRCCDNRRENMGAANSFVWIGPSWGRLSSGPFRLWKSSTAEGGIRVPALLRIPGESSAGNFDGVVTVKDIMPTLLELAGVALPSAASVQYRLQGRSLLAELGERAPTGWELSGKRALLDGNWKLLWDDEPFGDDRWTLHNLKTDPGETVDLSLLHPQEFERMLGLWRAYAEENNVLEEP